MNYYGNFGYTPKVGLDILDSINTCCCDSLLSLCLVNFLEKVTRVMHLSRPENFLETETRKILSQPSSNFQIC